MTSLPTRRRLHIGRQHWRLRTRTALTAQSRSILERFFRLRIDAANRSNTARRRLHSMRVSARRSSRPTCVIFGQTLCTPGPRRTFRDAPAQLRRCATRVGSKGLNWTGRLYIQLARGRFLRAGHRRGLAWLRSELWTSASRPQTRTLWAAAASLHGFFLLCRGRVARSSSSGGARMGESRQGERTRGQGTSRPSGGAIALRPCGTFGKAENLPARSSQTFMTKLLPFERANIHKFLLFLS